MLTKCFQKGLRGESYIFPVIYQDKLVSLLCGKDSINLYESEERGGGALFIWED